MIKKHSLMRQYKKFHNKRFQEIIQKYVRVSPKTNVFSSSRLSSRLVSPVCGSIKRKKIKTGMFYEQKSFHLVITGT